MSDVEVRPGAPYTFVVEVVPSNVGAVLQVTIKTETGRTVIYMTPDQATAIASMIESRAELAKAGLVLPQGVQLPWTEDPKAN